MSCLYSRIVYICSMMSFNCFVKNSLASCSFLQDEAGVISIFCDLGQIHPTYTECIAQELLQEVGSLKAVFIIPVSFS